MPCSTSFKSQRCGTATSNSASSSTTSSSTSTAPNSYLPHISIPPQVKIRCILAEAAQQEIHRRSSDRLEQISKLKEASRHYKFMVELSTGQRGRSVLGEPTSTFLPHQHTTQRNCDGDNSIDSDDDVGFINARRNSVANTSHHCNPLTDDTDASDAISAATSIGTAIALTGHQQSNNTSSFLHLAASVPMTQEELSYQQAIADANALIQHHYRLMDDETDDVAQCYAELMMECETTVERLVAEGKRIAAINLETELQNFASHVLMLHASLFPWRNGILLEPTIKCAAGHPLYERGWLANGRSEGMLFLSFAASAQVSQARQVIPSENKRRIVEEANKQLQAYKQKLQAERETAASGANQAEKTAENGLPHEAPSSHRISAPIIRMLAPVDLHSPTTLHDADEFEMSATSPAIYSDDEGFTCAVCIDSGDAVGDANTFSTNSSPEQSLGYRCASDSTRSASQGLTPEHAPRCDVCDGSDRNSPSRTLSENFSSVCDNTNYATSEFTFDSISSLDDNFSRDSNISDRVIV